MYPYTPLALPLNQEIGFVNLQSSLVIQVTEKGDAGNVSLHSDPFNQSFT